MVNEWLNRCERHFVCREVGAFVPEVDVVKPTEDSHVLVLKSADHTKLVVFDIADCFSDGVLYQAFACCQRTENCGH